MHRLLCSLGLGLSLLALAACEEKPEVVDYSAYPNVSASYETDPVDIADDAADDIAIWYNASEPAESLIIGTNKKSGLALYTLKGEQVFFLEVGRVNNVDLRQIDETLVVASNRTSHTIDVFRLNGKARSLERVASKSTGHDDPYGLCLYDGGPVNGFVAFVTYKDGTLQSWSISSETGGDINIALIATTNVGAQAEGCVADDSSGTLFVGVEEVGLYAMDAMMLTFDQAVEIDTTGGANGLTADVEGLALYYGQDGQTYLIASSQGDHTYMLYDHKPPYAFRYKFHIGPNMKTGLDGTSETDGIEALGLPLGAEFPEGVFVAQDGNNTDPTENQNFKIVDWRSIKESMSQ